MKANCDIHDKLKFSLLLIMTFLFFASFCCNGVAETGVEELRKITVSHQPCFDSFNTFWAIKNGIFEKNNLEVEMMYFDSGMPQIEALPAKEWSIGPVGVVPALFAVLRMDVYIIAVAHDESGSMSVLARPDSPVFKTKGYNPEYPNLYGDPETVKGMTALATTISTSHYTLARYLDDLGLSESDLKVLNLEQPQAVAAFERGEGDMVAFFSPYSYIGKAKGWKEVANGSDTGAKSLLVIISPRKWADENPDIVVDFLDSYFEAQEDLVKQGPVLADEYKKFLMDYSALEISDDNARGDFEDIIFYTLEEHLENLENGNFEKWTKESADFFYEKGRFTKEDRDKLVELHFGYTDKFMKLVAKKRGIIK